MKSIFRYSIFLFTLLLTNSCSKDVPNQADQARSQQYTLTVIAGEGGSISPNATGTYDAGTQIGLTATPNQGYSFVQWSGTDRDNGGCGMSGPGVCRATFTMNTNREVRAFFQSNSE